MGQMMTGHKQILAMRASGYKPTSVFIEIDEKPINSGFIFDDPESAVAQGMYPIVFAGDLRHFTDVRFLVGCQVHINCKVITESVLMLSEGISKLTDKVIVNSCDELLIFENGVWNANIY